MTVFQVIHPVQQLTMLVVLAFRLPEMVLSLTIWAT